MSFLGETYVQKAYFLMSRRNNCNTKEIYFMTFPSYGCRLAVDLLAITGFRIISLTNLDAIRSDVKNTHHATNESPYGLEVQTTDAPRSINKQDDIGLGGGFARYICTTREQFSQSVNYHKINNNNDV